LPDRFLAAEKTRSAVSQYEAVLYEVDDGVATITLNRPEVLNALNAQLRVELIAAIRQAASDDAVRVAILTGAGRAFSTGADLAEKHPPNHLPQIQLEDEYKPGLMAIAEAPKPFISVVNGAAAGAACGYAMVCDLMVMADDAYILQAFGAIGLIPDAGATWQLVRQLGSKCAYELIISGERLSAQRCLELGLANRVVPGDALMSCARGWAKQLSGLAPLALRYAKQSLRKVMNMELGDAISYEAALQNRLIRSRDAQEGIEAFLQKRKPQFVGN
jgi:2-(1,2-epoxy-1,2-dihydrophenyl)acetyl-CoA isomerase